MDLALNSNPCHWHVVLKQYWSRGALAGVTFWDVGWGNLLLESFQCGAGLTQKTTLAIFSPSLSFKQHWIIGKERRVVFCLLLQLLQYFGRNVSDEFLPSVNLSRSARGWLCVCRCVQGTAVHLWLVQTRGEERLQSFQVLSKEVTKASSSSRVSKRG